MNRSTLRTIARLLAPWRTIRRLEAENQRLEIKIRSAELLIDRIAATELRDARLRHCSTHGQQPLNAWGCPECVRELRAELATAKQEARRLRAALMLIPGRPVADPEAHY